MSYRVLYADQFHAAIDEQLGYFASQGAPESRTAGWLRDLLKIVDSLDASPLRYPIAEPESTVEGAEVRRIVFGDYLLFYHVDEKREQVFLLGFRHSAKAP